MLLGAISVTIVFGWLVLTKPAAREGGGRFGICLGGGAAMAATWPWSLGLDWNTIQFFIFWGVGFGILWVLPELVKKLT